jgi:hypothetical protein
MTARPANELVNVIAQQIAEHPQFTYTEHEGAGAVLAELRKPGAAFIVMIGTETWVQVVKADLIAEIREGGLTGMELRAWRHADEPHTLYVDASYPGNDQEEEDQ